MDCKKERNKRFCTCTYPGCGKRGLCCDCIRFHKEMGEIPGCLFPPGTEKTFDRSVKRFIESRS